MVATISCPAYELGRWQVAAPHANASGRASRDKARVGRIHIVVNVRWTIERLLYEVYMGARDGR
jgi:hypothetical protein